MRKMTLAVFIVFIFSLIVNYKVVLTITSLISAVVSLNVSPVPQGVITSFSYPSSIAVNNPMNFSVGFKNVGNVNITEKIIIFIKSSDLQTSAILRDDAFTLGIDETRQFNTTYIPSSSGTFFAFVVVTYDNKTAETNGTFSVTAPPAPLPAVPAPVGVPPPVITETVTISTIPAGEDATIAITQHDKLKIQKIVIEVRNIVNNVQITVKEASLPAVVPTPITPDKGVTNKYLEISKTNIQDADIAKAKIKFKVEKVWIANNNIDKSSIALYRYGDNKWNKLITNKIDEDVNYFYFESESPGLSLFAIAGEKSILTIEYVESIKLNRGQTALLNIWVKNTGDKDLNNLVLFASAAGISLDISPTALDTLPINSSFVFLITVNVSREVSPGVYTIDFTLASDRITKKGQIKLEVEVLAIELEVDQSIKNYEISVEKLSQEVDKAEKEGRNVTLALESLSLAKYELEIAKKLYNFQDYEGAKQHLENVRKNLEEATIQLAKTIRPKIIFVPFPRPELVGSIAMGAGTTFVLYYRKKKEDEKYRKAIRNAMQIIKNRGKR